MSETRQDETARMPITEALGLVKKRLPRAFETIRRVLDDLGERIAREQAEAHAAFATVKAALQEGSAHVWGCPYSLQGVPAQQCKNGTCLRVQDILAAPTVPAYLARALALESLVQHHVRHDPLCPWWSGPTECSCGLAAMVKFFADAL